MIIRQAPVTQNIEHKYSTVSPFTYSLLHAFQTLLGLSDSPRSQLYQKGTDTASDPVFPTQVATKVGDRIRISVSSYANNAKQGSAHLYVSCSGYQLSSHCHQQFTFLLKEKHPLEAWL